MQSRSEVGHVVAEARVVEREPVGLPGPCEIRVAGLLLEASLQRRRGPTLLGVVEPAPLRVPLECALGPAAVIDDHSAGFVERLALSRKTRSPHPDHGLANFWTALSKAGASFPSTARLYETNAS